MISTRSAMKPPRRGKSIGLHMSTASSSPGTGASNWSNNYIAFTSTQLHAAGASPGLGTTASA